MKKHDFLNDLLTEVNILYNEYETKHKCYQFDERYIKLNDYFNFINKLKFDFNYNVEKIGSSKENRDVYSVSSIEYRDNINPKILMWTQMHGNESSGTLACIDLIMSGLFQKLKISFKLILILNPDGALNFTRENADGIDINRDAVECKTKEMKILRNEIKLSEPDYLFNLHDQRRIFHLEGTCNPASLAFLAPSVDKARTLTPQRKEVMDVIGDTYSIMKEILPNRIAKFTDEFYPTATGDNFQKEGHKTILIESGGEYGDYSRKLVRKYTFISIYTLSRCVTNKMNSPQTNQLSITSYESIPNNSVELYEIVIKNVFLVKKGKKKLQTLVVHYEEYFEKNKFKYKLKYKFINLKKQAAAYQQILNYNLYLDNNKIKNDIYILSRLLNLYSQKIISDIPHSLLKCKTNDLNF